MKLIRIQHERCNEWSASSYALAPDDWDDEQISRAIRAAQDDYLAFEQEFRERQSDNGFTAHYFPGHPSYEQHPDKTVREVQELHAAQKTEWQRWRDREYQSRQPFSAYLEKHGLIRLVNAEEEHGIQEFDLDWGHRHGWRLDYSDELPEEPRLLGHEE